MLRERRITFFTGVRIRAAWGKRQHCRSGRRGCRRRRRCRFINRTRGTHRAGRPRAGGGRGGGGAASGADVAWRHHRRLGHRSLLRPLTAAAATTSCAVTAAVLPSLLLLLLFLGRLHHARAPAAHLYVIQFPNVVVVREQRLELFAAAAAAAMMVVVLMSGVLLAHDRVRV